MKKISYVLFIVLLLFQSCVVYQTQSFTLDQAVNKGKVKLIGKSGQVFKFDNISLIDSAYFGIGREYISKTQYITKEGAKTPLDSTSISGIYIRDGKKSKKRTVWTIVGISIPATYVVLVGIAVLFFVL